MSKDTKVGTRGGGTSSDTTDVATAAGIATRTNNVDSNADLEYYYKHYDTNQLQEWKNQKVYMNDPRYFQKVMISPTAIMKMMMHCQSGVTKGIQKGGNPIEVMGILLGKPDINNPSLIVTDAFPLPIEGFETRVIADDENVVNHMISLNEVLENNRYEKFMGWYHSHPFDYIPQQSHCFLSQTDLSTQLQWQRAEDPHGNPFVAIVIDPIRSMLHQQPELKSFRAFPPEYNSPTVHECPDGTIEHSEQIRLEKWGSCWNRYYELDVEYYMSRTSRNVLETLTKDYLWIRALHNQPISKVTDQLCQCCKQFQQVASSKTASGTKGTTAASKSKSSTASSSGTGATTAAATASQQRDIPHSMLSSGLSAGKPMTSSVLKMSNIDGATNTISVDVNNGIVPTPCTVNIRNNEYHQVIQQISNISDEQKAQKMIDNMKQYVFL